MTRRQRAWTKTGVVHFDRTSLPGLHWQLGSGTWTSPEAALDFLRGLWSDHGNVGALRDALWLCREGTEPAGLALPAWLAEVFDSAVMDPARLAGRWTAYTSDMIDLHRFDLFGLARAHGLSVDEAAAFVAEAEREADRPTTAAAVRRLTRVVPQRARANPGRYYIARVYGLTPLGPLAKAGPLAHAALNRRTARPALFISARVSGVSSKMRR